MRSNKKEFRGMQCWQVVAIMLSGDLEEMMAGPVVAIVLSFQMTQMARGGGVQSSVNVLGKAGKMQIWAF